jgi:hypothetical protein
MLVRTSSQFDAFYGEPIVRHFPSSASKRVDIGMNIAV